MDNPAYFEELSNRNNALVLGDSLGDIGMDKGMHNPGAILKIGFLNDKISERMESFVNSFDVVWNLQLKLNYFILIFFVSLKQCM